MDPMGLPFWENIVGTFFQSIEDANPKKEGCMIGNTMLAGDYPIGF